MNDPQGSAIVSAGLDALDLGPDDFVASVPRGLATKAELLAALATALDFPEWFGANWDALCDCLSDLSWIAARRVVVVHGDLPLADPDQRARYVDTLRDAIERRNRDPAPALIVVFPPAPPRRG